MYMGWRLYGVIEGESATPVADEMSRGKSSKLRGAEYFSNNSKKILSAKLISKRNSENSFY